MEGENNTTAEQQRVVAQTEMLVFRNSAIHGVGGFAKVPIATGTRIIEYVGERITKQESLARCEAQNEYIFTLTDKVDLDGKVDWNPARFINHSCTPNCEAIMEEERIWIVACRDIQPGEEVVFNYGFDLVDYKEHPCRCGTPQCVGYMVAEEFFPHVERARRASQA